ncbi:hypothetical protein [Gemmata sp.]|uniref:hypothetical protein n=1 Tax=Gemmata sp. TaxID=1914242 RepID=UPI003F6F82F4
MRARAALRRRPGFTDRQHASALQKGLALFDVAVELVSRDARSLLRRTDVRAARFPAVHDWAGEARDRCPGFPAAAYPAALSWVFYQYHLR